MLSTLQETASGALSVVRLKLSQLEVTEIDKDGDALMRPYAQPALTTFYKNRSLLFSAAG